MTGRHKREIQRVMERAREVASERGRIWGAALNDNRHSEPSHNRDTACPLLVSSITIKSKINLQVQDQLASSTTCFLNNTNHSSSTLTPCINTINVYGFITRKPTPKERIVLYNGSEEEGEDHRQTSQLVQSLLHS